jgi:glucosamine-6-phosphate deaminase
VQISVFEDEGALARELARRITDAVRENPAIVLGLPTGRTPIKLYDELARGTAGRVSWARVTTFNLDEFVGIPASHPSSYRQFMEQHLFRHVDASAEHLNFLDGTAADLDAECRRYEGAIETAGGIDLQILGIGTDGHIGFNEPGSSFASQTRVKTLTEQTRRDNARFFDSVEDVPMHCITQGLGTILRARHLVLLAFGEGKAAAVEGAVEGAVTASLPGSAVQLHPRATIVVDEAAASRLARADYYRYAYDNKPDWQGI